MNDIIEKEDIKVEDIILEIWFLYEYTYQNILELSSNNKEKADNIWNEINFCRTMIELKTPSYLKETDVPVLKLTINNL